MSDVVNLQDYSVTVKGQTYSMVKVPDVNSALVVEAKAKILQNLTLDQVTTNLDRAGKLIYVAYNGVARAPKLRGAVIVLSDNLGKLSAECELTMQAFQTGSATILKNLKEVFSFLVKGKEDAALRFLDKAGQAAAAMASKADTLANKFERLGNDTVKIGAKAATEEGNEDQRRRKYEADIADFEAKTEYAKTLAEKLEDSKEELQKLLEEVRAKAETAENRAFALSIVSSIMKPIGEGLGAFAGAMTRSQMPSNLPPSLPRDYYDTPPPRRSSTTPRRSDDDDAPPPRRGRDDDDDDDAPPPRRGRDDDDDDDDAPPPRRGRDDDDDDAPPPRRGTTRRGRDDDDEDAPPPRRGAGGGSSRLEGTGPPRRGEGLSRETVAEIDAAGETLEGVGDATGKMGGDFYGLVESYRAEQQRYLELLQEQLKEQREALASIAEYAVRMANLKSEIQIVKAARDSLHQAVGALTAIAAALRVASTFWKQMATFCGDLAQPDLQDKIDAYKADPDRIAFYVEADFKLEVVSYLAGWQALAVVCREYSAVCAQSTARIYNDFQKNPTIEQSIRDTPKLAAELLASAQTDLEASDAMSDAIESELQALQAEQEAA